MNVQLTPELHEMIGDKVNTGEYTSATEVVKEALLLLEKRDLAREEIRQKIDAGLESLRQGKGIDGEEFTAQMLAELDDEAREEHECAECDLLVKA